MTKNIRVYELARELNVKSKEILTILQEELKLDIQNHMSMINDRVAQRVRELLRKDAAPAPAGQATAAPATTRKRSEPAAAKGAAVAAKPPVQAPQTQQRAERAERKQAEPDGRQPKAARSQRSSQRPQQPTGRKAKSSRSRRPATDKARDAAAAKTIQITDGMTVAELAQQLGQPPAKVIQTLMGYGVMATVNQSLDLDSAVIVAESFGATFETVEAEPRLDQYSDEAILANLPGEEKKRMKPRPPVVTVLGHVDHGKTSLLDAIRESNVAAGEAGGITQHIGASVVEHQGRKIVFLDTPGHEAFTQMRARGAQITDIAVLVVAADDGVMPQTVEAISHAKAAGVPIIVAVNKIDKPTANVDRVLQQLTEHGLVPEEWGGDTVCVPVSALQRQGIDQLLEMILLVADIAELQADPHANAVGTVIESELDTGRGPVATVLIQRGTLKRGDAFIAGDTWGRVRAMFDDRGRPVKQATPSMPVEILGFQAVPEAGDRLIRLKHEKQARDLAEQRSKQSREVAQQQRGAAMTLEELYRKAQAGEQGDLNVVLKADVQGSLEAVRDALLKLGTSEVSVQVIHAGVGAITESDVMLASASSAIILGFNVRPNSKAKKLAESERIEIRTYRIIYDLVNDVKNALEGLLAPELREVTLGQAEVRQVFKVPGAGMVAGCYVSEGVVRRNANVRVVRDGRVVHEGDIDSLKRFKDDVREVREGYECGIGIANFNDIKEGDILEIYITEEVQRRLEDSPA